MSNKIWIKLSDVEFFEKLRKSKYSVQRMYVIKVYYGKDPSEFDPSNRKINLSISKSTVYRGMNSKGSWKRRPAAWPDLHLFDEDSRPPNAIFIEYVPNLQPIDLSDFSERRLAKVRKILEDIHPANSRNMTASLEDYERILWIDFNPALIVSEHDLSSRQERWIADEVEMIDY
ncbi:uncharacterized protein BO95DRAFT_449768 [Aspergillus brunneoviolaceus CBS 621.78]|uniref:Uncharacterized protein n=1 Tax=Aspergillus brunneoviolaceus CBS 621.78 TaxID=1450534 RepID=A0ACD1GL65_9EURO|nr:hypothetical protein BO95DRAFT_449768 [Aspergillus brunneoviolaceus CBS 621.78]RAH50001.1 hypothetical protein BO95DRAFT_449768 [Aspergillus brunneoviolaceus CBS 621.78]